MLYANISRKYPR